MFLLITNKSSLIPPTSNNKTWLYKLKGVENNPIYTNGLYNRNRHDKLPFTSADYKPEFRRHDAAFERRSRDPDERQGVAA